MKSLSYKTNFLHTSVIRGMSALARKYGALNFAQGYPEFSPNTAIMDKLRDIAYDNKFHQYPIGYGALNVRTSLANKEKHFTGIEYDVENEIVITCGGTEAMSSTILTLCDKGDTVGAFSPIYENYYTACLLAEAELKYVQLEPENGYRFDANKLEEVFKSGIKAFILCNPSNPSGRVFTIDELKVIADLAKKYDVYIISDEVYEHIVYAPNKMTYIATLPDMLERTIVCGSLSKTYSITGWRIGYVLANKNIIDKLKKVHNFLTISTTGPLQEAANVGLNFSQDYYDSLLKLYTKNRDIMIDGFNDLGIKLNKPEGTYFMLLDLNDYIDRSKYKTDLEFAEMLCQTIGVCLVPCETFFKDVSVKGIFRIHFAKNENTLFEMLNKFAGIKKLI